MIPNNYLEKVYAGFLGMNIGIRLGAPVEPTLWTYERIQNTYGDITSYVKTYKNFAADDDANGPVFFLRALYDDAKDRELVPQDVARAWLNYAREEKGMFWWGGYGISTEHTAYQNLKMGIPAPKSGSIEQNGQILAEQIGGQIFIDTWGLVLPCNPEKAAQYGEYAASVSHDGDGINGARFFCAAISKAFESSNIREIIDTGLSYIPKTSTYYAVAQAVIKFYEENPNDFRACRSMLENYWGYDKYKGVCHIIPNAGVCILAMLYGKGEFNRTIEIATMCGWDTDCNAGNVGTVLGVMCGITGLAKRYRDPINDSIVLSSISGYLNILDIPSYAKELALLGYRLAQEEAPLSLKNSFKEGEIYFDFELPGSTHNIRLSDSFLCSIEHTFDHGYNSNGSLKILFDRMSRGQNCKVYYKPYYLRSDFSDERYSPVFSPTVYSGQIVSMKIYLDQWNGNETMGFAPYIHLANSKQDIIQGYIKLIDQEWLDVEFIIPSTEGDLIDEVGIILESYSPAKFKSLGCIYLDDFKISGPSTYSIDFSKQKSNFGSISPFSHNYGAWSLENDKMLAMSYGYAESYAGNYFAKNYVVTAIITPLHGNTHMLSVRAQGAQKGYHAGFDRPGFVALYLNDFGFTKLTEVPFDWTFNTEYTVSFSCNNVLLEVFINGKQLIAYNDSTFTYGMYGCSRLSMGRTAFSHFKIREY
ncbi:ADP-ribosylglycohydrolase family protein [Niameybacter massiliensis]|uniref:ADP-ribosylglycohydrolase family protein n=1 Tax=Niameybacter massiliensis TaxID=1658108 RepID=UPI0006B406DE|nr:ADP-ribosylglycohydrolase family protein [Niameybacter massiliensis]